MAVDPSPRCRQCFCSRLLWPQPQIVGRYDRPVGMSTQWVCVDHIFGFISLPRVCRLMVVTQLQREMCTRQTIYAFI